MLKSEIIEKLVERWEPQAYNTTRAAIREQTKTMVDSIFNAMSAALANGRRIEVRGFGAFTLKTRPPGFVRNPCHKITIESDERHVVYFRPSTILAARVDKINQKPTKPAKKTAVKTKPKKVA